MKRSAAKVIAIDSHPRPEGLKPVTTHDLAVLQACEDTVKHLKKAVKDIRSRIRKGAPVERWASFELRGKVKCGKTEPMKLAIEPGDSHAG